MTLMSKNIGLLTFLYFIQGLPYGFQASFLPMYLRMQGVSLTNLGLFKLLLAPWMLKALWAPLVDKRATKQKWLLWSVAGLVFVCAFASLSSPKNLYVLCVIVFCLNLFAATQDIAVDGIAVALLRDEELGKGNTAQVVGYKIGSIFGGGVLVWFMDSLGWSGLFLVLTLLYIEALLFIHLSPVLRNLHIDNTVDWGIAKTEDAEQNECTEVIGDSVAEETELLETENLAFQGESFDSSDSNRSDSFEIVDRFQTLKEQDETKTAEIREDSPAEFLQDEACGEVRRDSEVDAMAVNDLADKELDKKAQVKEDTGADIPQGETDGVTDGVVTLSNDDAQAPEVDPCETSDVQDSDANVASEPLMESGKLKKRKVELRSGNGERQEKVAVSASDDSVLEMESREREGQQFTEFEPLDTVTQWTQRLVGTRAECVREVLLVPGTMWMLVYVLIYKLGEQGAVGMLPLFLVDRKIRPADTTFWMGVVGQAVSIIGSVLGGYVISKYRLPTAMFLQQLTLCRLMPMGLTLWVVALWQWKMLPVALLFYAAVFAAMVMLLISGMVTTVTFTFMMQCSRGAHPSIQATHYTVLATVEVLGKLSFASVAGWLVDMFDYAPMYLVFTGLAASISFWFQRMPSSLDDAPKLKSS